MVRELRADVRIGHFTHIPFPGYEIFAQLPWRRQIVRGLLGADLLGFQRQSDTTNFLRACRRTAGLATRGSLVRVPDSGVTDPPAESAGRGFRRQRVAEDLVSGRDVRAAAFPISIDSAAIEEIAKSPEVQARAQQIREALGKPETVLLGIDRLDYTKGILHRLNAYGEILEEGRLGPPAAVLVQIASPSRERVESYRHLRDEVEVTVGRINGDYGEVGNPPIHYLHQSYPKDELVAYYLAADVMLVTPLRDGMNLVAKEYVASRYDETGALVLSEFTGAADELHSAFIINPHDIDGLKDTIVRAATVSPAEARRQMRSMRRRVLEHDVAYWARTYLDALSQVPVRDHPAADPVG
jgi:trehalose 6-phosphate synthase